MITLTASCACLFMLFFCLFSPFPQLHSPLCAFEKWKNILKKTYKNFKDINLNNFWNHMDCRLRTCGSLHCLDSLRASHRKFSVLFPDPLSSGVCSNRYRGTHRWRHIFHRHDRIDEHTSQFGNYHSRIIWLYVYVRSGGAVPYCFSVYEACKSWWESCGWVNKWVLSRNLHRRLF